MWRPVILDDVPVSVLGLALTFVLPEPAGRSLDDIAATTLRNPVQNRPAADLTPAA